MIHNVLNATLNATWLEHPFNENMTVIMMIIMSFYGGDVDVVDVENG